MGIPSTPFPPTPLPIGVYYLCTSEIFSMPFQFSGRQVRRVLQEPEEVSEMSLRGLPDGRNGPQPRTH